MYTKAQTAAIGMLVGFQGDYHTIRTVSVTCEGLLIANIDSDHVEEVTDLSKTLGIADLIVFGKPSIDMVVPGFAKGIVHVRTFARREEITVNGRQTACSVSMDGRFVTMADKYSEMCFDIEAIDATIAALTSLKAVAATQIEAALAA